MVEHRHARFKAGSHRGAIDLHQNIADQPGLEIDILGDAHRIIERRIFHVTRDDIGSVIALQIAVQGIGIKGIAQIVGNDRNIVEIAVDGVLAQFAERLARAEHARRPIDLGIDISEQTEKRAAHRLGQQAAQGFLAAVEGIAAIAREQLVARIAGKRDSHMLPGQLGDLIGGQRRTVAERFVENAGKTFDRIGFVTGHHLDMLAAAITLRHLGRIRPFVEFGIGEADGKAFHRMGAGLGHQRHGGAGIRAAGKKRAHRHIGDQLRFHRRTQPVEQAARRIVQRLAVVAVGFGVPILRELRRLTACDRERVAGRKFLDAFIDGARIADIAEREEFLDCARIDPARQIGVLRQRLQFGAEDESAIGQERIVERLLAQPVAREEQRAFLRVPQHEGELAG